MSNRGCYGVNYDRTVENTNTSTLHKMKETYWTTKQAVIKKLGKKEDEHIVASDAQLDAKLEVFKAVQKSCMDLLRVIERYQDRLCALSQEENTMGRFLKSQSSHDKTRAGKMMAAVGKSQSFAAQQRLALRVPLVRLYQEVETFRYRAISDTLVTINRMESARTEYRGALLWMKNVSEELDPDMYNRLEKFRKVQNQVRKTKARFDKLKLDVMQKVDLLAASRCNMFSHVLANYQSTLLHFWEKTSRTMSAVAESFKGYQYYEFNMLKELAEPSKKLIDDSSMRETPQKDTDELEPDNEDTKSRVSDTKDDDKFVDDLLGSLGETKSMTGPRSRCPLCGQLVPNVLQPSVGKNSSHDLTELVSLTPCLHPAHKLSNTVIVGQQDKSKTHEEPSQVKPQCETGGQNVTENDEYKSRNPRLLEFEDGEEQKKETSQGDNLTSHLAKTEKNDQKPGDDFGPFIDFEVDDDDSFSQANEDFDFAGQILQAREKNKEMAKKVPTDLLTEELEQDDTDKDDMTLLNEILNAPSTGEDEFTQEWQAVFGLNQQPGSPTLIPAETDQPKQTAEFMPSNLLDLSSQMSAVSLGHDDMQGKTAPGGLMSGGKTTPQAGASQLKQAKSKQQNPPKKGQKGDMSAWFNLFADLDPLSDPDAIGREEKPGAL